MAELHRHNIVESVGHAGRATTVATVLNLNLDGEETSLPLQELIDDLQEALSNIPEEFRSSATVNFRGYGDYVNLDGEVTYKRPETDEEFAARKKWLDGLKSETEERDRLEFERLSRKFANSAVTRTT